VTMGISCTSTRVSDGSNPVHDIFSDGHVDFSFERVDALDLNAYT
jgi:hypothetical protein